MSHSIRLLRYTDHDLVAEITNARTGLPLSAMNSPPDGAEGTIQIFDKDNEAITGALPFSEEAASPVTGVYVAELEGGSPPLDIPAGRYKAKIVITAPSDAVYWAEVHVIDGVITP